MSKAQMFVVAVASTILVSPLPGAPFAEAVMHYDPGVDQTPNRY